MINEQYHETVEYSRTYLNEEQPTQMSEEQLNWLTNAYHNARDLLKCIKDIENSAQHDEEVDEEDHVSSALDEKRDELIAICNDVLNFVDRNLFQNLNTSTRETAFALKLKGDFLR